MKILIQVGHPAQFHFYKNAIRLWLANGHQVRVLIKKKDILENLLVTSGFDYVNFENRVYNKSSKLELFKMLISRSYNFIKQIIKYRPNIVISPDPILSKICFFLKINFVAVSEDDYLVIKKLADLLFPTSDVIFAPRVCDFSLWQNKKIEYEGYMKLAYLHPNHFVPNREILKTNLEIDKPYVIIRLVELTAHHDHNISGINNEILDKIIEKFQSLDYNVYISSERKLTSKYNRFHINAPVENIHHIMAFASFLICDSQSMAVEAAMLGVPSIRFNDFAGKISVLEELEHKYGLTFGIKTDNPDKLYQKVNELLEMDDLREKFQERRQKMLSDKIDVTAFLVWFIENYPESARIMKENPDYQYNFK